MIHRQAPRRPRTNVFPTLALLALTLLAGSALFAGSAAAQFDDMTIEPLSRQDAEKNAAQAEVIEGLVRRRLGSNFGAGLRPDLRLLQRLLDERIVRPDEDLVLQSMGVVLGDMMAEELRLTWVSVEDKYGPSRALRFRESRELFFPVTMIWRRVKHDQPVDVEAIYNDIARQVLDLEGRTN